MRKRAILSVIAACVLVCTGCSDAKKVGKESKNNTVKLEYQEPNDRCEWSVKKIKLPDEMKITEGLEALDNGKLLVYGYNSDERLMGLITDESLESFESFEFEADISSEESVQITADDKGEVFAATCKDNTAILYKFDSKGKLLHSSELQIDVGEGILSAAYKSGKLFLCMRTGEKIYAVTDSGETAGEFRSQMDCFFSDIAVDRDGKLMAASVNGTAGQLCEIDVEKLEFTGDTYEVNLNGKLFRGTGEFRLYSGCVYGIAESSSTQVVNMLNSGIDSGEVSDLAALSNGNFVGIGLKSESNIVLLSKNTDSISTEKTEISVAIIGDSEIEMKALEFNSQNNNYAVTIKNYLENAEGDSPREEYDNAVRQLYLDAVSGESPDILAINDDDTMRGLIAKGMFCDLYSYIDSDQKVSRETFLPNLLKLMETDGKLYTISDCFSIDTIAIKSDFVSSEWNMESLRNLYESKDGVDLFESGNNNISVFYNLFREQSYVDYEENSCSFDTDEFIDFLKFCGGFGDIETDSSLNEDTSGKISRGEALLSSIHLQNFRDYADWISYLGDDITLVGYPETGGTVCTGIHFGITANSQKKDGAWEFLRTFFLPNDVAGNYHENMSVVESDYRQAAENSMEAPFYIDGDGKKEYFDEESNTLTREQVDRLDSYIRSLTSYSGSSNDSEVKSICLEEAQAYFAGECTAEDAAQRIQNRVSIYLSEKQ